MEEINAHNSGYKRCNETSFGHEHALKSSFIALSAGPYTGAALNPARVFGPTLVFDCFWDTAFVYMTGQLLGGLLAAAIVLPLYGFGQFGSLFDTRILSWISIQVPHRFQQVSFYHTTHQSTRDFCDSPATLNEAPFLLKCWPADTKNSTIKQL